MLVPHFYSAVLVLSTLGIFGCAASHQTSGGGAGSGGSGSTGQGAGDMGGGSLGGGDPGPITQSCGESSYASQVAGSVLVVLDRSGSMASVDGLPGKWAPTVAALKSMMGQANPEVGMGLLPFPEGQFDANQLVGCDVEDPVCQAMWADGGCEDVSTTPAVEVAPLSVSQAAIHAWLDANGNPIGFTPTLTALKNAYAYMQSVNVSGERFVLLLTDGEPTTYVPGQVIDLPDPTEDLTILESYVACKDLPDIQAETLAAAGAPVPVKTFVIGSPGSEAAADFLSQLAIDGQTQRSPDCSAAAGNCHYQIGAANFQQDLQAALDEIAGKLSECVFEIPNGEDADPDYVNVVLEDGGTTTQLSRDTAHQDGWDYTDGTHTKVEIYGPSCGQFKAVKGAKVLIVLGCKTIVK